MLAAPPVHAQEAQQAQPQQQAPAQAVETSLPVIKVETRLVLVDTVVTDKKGTYIRDLKQQDFRVFEDNKEQPIKSFSYETDTATPAGNQRRYLVLFFDNSTMDLADQARAREAAGKFIEANAGPNRYMAVVDFGGTVKIAQNFTADAERLKQVVRNVKFASVSPNAEPVQLASLGAPSLTNSEADFGARTLLLALRSIAKNMSSVPGRKSLILLTAGFPMTPDRESELTAVISVCNRANVAIYPIDVRGLITGVNAATPSPAPISFRTGDDYAPARLVTAELQYSGSGDAQPAHLVYVQRGTGGTGSGGAGGGRTGGGTGTGGTGGKNGGTTTGGPGGNKTGGPSTTGTRGGGATSPYPYAINPYNQSRQIVPAIPPLASTNQQLLYELAEGTGGFVIVNSNDLLGGMERIAKEQSEYYVLGYTPGPSDEGSCHTLSVKVDRGGTVVRSRSGYCNARPVDLLAGKPSEKQLENRATGSQTGTLTASMRAPYFYTSPDTARVNLAMEIPPSAFKFDKQKGKFRAAVDVLGLAYKPDGTVGARFSDTVNVDLDGKKEVEEFNKKPMHYDNQFDVAAGHYNLKVVFSSGGESFGKLEFPLLIDPYDGKKFTMSTVVLSKEMHPVSEMTASLDAAMLEDRSPLVSQGIELIPSGSDQFKKTDHAAFYVEVYDPLLVGATPPKVAIQVRVFDRATNDKKIDSGGAISEAKAGNPMVPIGLRIPLENLPPGSYRLELKAMDSAGNTSPQRTADFEVQ